MAGRPPTMYLLQLGIHTHTHIHTHIRTYVCYIGVYANSFDGPIKSTKLVQLISVCACVCVHV